MPIPTYKLCYSNKHLHQHKNYILFDNNTTCFIHTCPGAITECVHVLLFDVLQYTKMILNQRTTRYTQNGILHMLDRNRRIKPRPERFQDSTKQFDVIFTAEERIYDAVVESEYLKHRLKTLYQPYLTIPT